MSTKSTINDSLLTHQVDAVYHVPVLLHECIQFMNIKADGVYVDCTFGGGGHSKEILKHLGQKGRLFVFDQDWAAAKNVPPDERVVFIPQNFRHLQKFLRLHHCNKVDGILADLGVSSHQFDEAERGFSIRFDSKLDMRMNERQSNTAADIIANYSEQELQLLFEKFGEVTNAKTLARTIVLKRGIAAIETTTQFKQAIHEIVKGNPNKYLAKVFQALRIAVNDEMGALKDLLIQSIDVLNTGGRILIITFHSLEDRMVKTFFKIGDFEEPTPMDVYGNKKKSSLAVITKKPVVASDIEIKNNSRSRSAKLRVAERI